MVKKRRYFLAGALAAASMAAAFATPASASTNAPVKASDFVNIGSITANVKIQGWDGNCVTFAQPVAGSAVGVAPCSGGHNWDWVVSADGLQVVMEAHGTNLAIGDSGGVLQLRPYNQTSDSFVSPQNTQFTKGGNEYEGYAFSETNPNFVYMAVNSNNSMTPTTTWTIHCDYRRFAA